jgi:hypothetical protein
MNERSSMYYDDDGSEFLGLILIIGIVAVIAFLVIALTAGRNYSPDGNPHNGWVKSEPIDYRCDNTVLIYADGYGAVSGDERCGPR